MSLFKIGVFAPQDLEDVLYTSHRFVPVKERMGWIRGSNLGYTTALQVDKIYKGWSNLNGSRLQLQWEIETLYHMRVDSVSTFFS